jgi:hypothetical protein
MVMGFFECSDEFALSVTTVATRKANKHSAVTAMAAATTPDFVDSDLTTGRKFSTGVSRAFDTAVDRTAITITKAAVQTANMNHQRWLIRAACVPAGSIAD